MTSDDADVGDVNIDCLFVTSNKAPNGTVRSGFWTEPKEPKPELEPNRNRTEPFGSTRNVSSDRRKTNFSSLDSSHRDESNGNCFVSLGAIDNEIIRL